MANELKKITGADQVSDDMSEGMAEFGEDELEEIEEQPIQYNQVEGTSPDSSSEEEDIISKAI